jgi:hypothetical protein
MFCCFFEVESHNAVQAGSELESLVCTHLLSAGITDVPHHAWHRDRILFMDFPNIQGFFSGFCM